MVKKKREVTDMSPNSLIDAVKNKGLTKERKERLSRFVGGFKNESKIDVDRMTKEVRGKE